MNRAAANPLQDEFAFDSIKSHAVFPGRVTLYVSEVAAKFEMTEQHVLNLLEVGELGGVNIAKGLGGTTKSGRTTAKYWRIPVAAYDAFIEKRRSDKSST